MVTVLSLPADEKDIPLRSPADMDAILRQADKMRARLASRDFTPAIFDAVDDGTRALWIQDLCAMGHHLFNLIFSPQDGKLFLRVLPPGDPPVIWMRDEQFSVPWELLHPEAVPKSGSATLSGFLGARALIVRRAATRQQSSRVSFEGRADPIISIQLEGSDGRSSVGHAFDHHLDSTKVPKEWSWWHPCNDVLQRIPLDELTGREADRPDLCRRLAAFVRSPFNVIHFDCHAEIRRGEQSKPDYVVRVRKDFLAGIDDIKLWKLSANPYALVFLNFCSSDTTVLGGDSVARLLQRNGGRSVIGTTAAVNDAFALIFAKEFYRRFCAGQSVGTSLFLTQQTLARQAADPKKPGNPAVFCYTLHGAGGHTLLTMSHRIIQGVGSPSIPTGAGNACARA